MQNNVTALSPIAEQPIGSTAAPTFAPAQEGFQPLLYLSRQPRLAAGVFLFLMLTGGYFLRGYLRPAFSTTSVVYVSPTFPHELTEDHEHDRSYDEFMQQQITAVTRYSNIQQAVEKFKDRWVEPGQDEQAVIAGLQKAMKVEQMGNSYQMSITLQSARRDGLAEFVNQITAGYLTSARNDEFFGRDERIATLTADRQRLTAELADAMAKQDSVLRQVGIAQYDPKSAINPYDTQLQQLRVQLAEAHEKRAEADAQVYSLNGKPSSTGTSALQEVAASQLTADPNVLTMESQLNTRRASLMLQMNGLTPQNPLYIQSQAEMNAIDRQLLDIRSKATNKVAGEIQRKTTSERERAARLEAQLNSDLNRTQALAADAAPKLLQAQSLSDRILQLQANFAAVDNRINSLNLEGSSPGSEHILTWAIPPSGPASSKHSVIAILGLLFLSSFGAIVAAFVADGMDQNIYTATDIHRMLGFPPIGLLLDEKDFSSTMTSEYLLRLAGGIDQAHRRTGARTFVFTSAGKGDTREIVQSLGAELSASGLNTLVILIDDQVKPAPSASSPTSIQTGLNPSIQRKELVVGQPTFGSGGHSCQVATVAPQGVADFMRRSRISYNAVLVAANPLLTSAHTEYLVRTADGTVLVAESGDVTKKQLARVARLLERLKISGIAIILSQIPKKRADKEITDNAAEYSERVAL